MTHDPFFIKFAVFYKRRAVSLDQLSAGAIGDLMIALVRRDCHKQISRVTAYRSIYLFISLNTTPSLTNVHNRPMAVVHHNEQSW